MTEQRQLTCICCPLGCQITVELNGSEITSITGNTCKRGEQYARREITAPTRTLTTTIPVRGGTVPSVAVKTAGEVPKALLLDCARALAGVTVQAPITPGQILIQDLLHTGIDVVATSGADAKTA